MKNLFKKIKVEIRKFIKRKVIRFRRRWLQGYSSELVDWMDMCDRLDEMLNEGS